MSISYRINGFMQAWVSGEFDKVQELLDIAVRLNAPTGILLGRRRVQAWMMFEHEVFTSYGIEIINTSTSDGTKSAMCEWRVGALHFTDHFSLNHSLIITGIHRQRLPSVYASEAQRKETKDILLKLVGPTLGASDPTMLPVLDFTHYGIVSPVDLIRLPPRGRTSKKISTARLTQYFMRYIQESEEQLSITQSNVQQKKKDEDRDEIVIMAKGKDGEQAAYHFDKAEMGKMHTAEEEKAAILESEDITVTDGDEINYQASGIKLANNEIASDLPIPNSWDFRLKQLIANAFYTLSYVDLSSNHLTVVPDLSQFPIMTLYLHDNNISDFKEVVKLKRLEQLQSLTLYRNPLQDSLPHYKFQVMNALDGTKDTPPRAFTLKKLDNSVLSDQDKKTMATFYTFTVVAQQNNKERKLRGVI